MEHIRTLKNIYISDVGDVGQRAVDMATLKERHFDVPLAFVIDADALETFVQQNSLDEVGGKLLADGNYEGLANAARQGTLPKHIISEIKEAYSSLAVGDEDAESIVDADNDVPVTVIPSPDYPTENFDGIAQNVRGIDAVLQAVKNAWASLLNKHAFDRRDEIGVKEFFAGCIVYKTPECEAHAVASTNPDEDEIHVQTRFGYPDYEETLDADTFNVDKATLTITDHNVNTQVHAINGAGEHEPIEERGRDQKVDDKTVIELGRLTKKMSNQLEEGMTAYYAIKHNTIELILADRMFRDEWFLGAEQPSDEHAADEDDFPGDMSDMPDLGPEMKSAQEMDDDLDDEPVRDKRRNKLEKIRAKVEEMQDLLDDGLEESFKKELDKLQTLVDNLRI
jgi:phosphoenolpyruvate synthase/pyruvate phosphate dikinase